MNMDEYGEMWFLGDFQLDKMSTGDFLSNWRDDLMV